MKEKKERKKKKKKKVLKKKNKRVICTLFFVAADLPRCHHHHHHPTHHHHPPPPPTPDHTFLPDISVMLYDGCLTGCVQSSRCPMSQGRTWICSRCSSTSCPHVSSVTSPSLQSSRLTILSLCLYVLQQVSTL